MKTLKAAFIESLEKARGDLNTVECRELALQIFREDLGGQLDRYLTAHRRLVIAAVENWWEKYKISFHEIETEKSNTAGEVDDQFRRLNYEN